MKGSIDLLLLSLLQQKKLYGYEMTKILKEMSMGKYEIGEGTLYPALKRMEAKQFIKGHWKESESGRRKYYSVTEMGQLELERKRQCFPSWKPSFEKVQKNFEQ